MSFLSPADRVAYLNADPPLWSLLLALPIALALALLLVVVWIAAGLLAAAWALLGAAVGLFRRRAAMKPPEAVSRATGANSAPRER